MPLPPNRLIVKKFLGNIVFTLAYGLLLTIIAAVFFEWWAGTHCVEYTFDHRYQMELIADECFTCPLDRQFDFDMAIKEINSGKTHHFQFSTLNGPTIQFLLPKENINDTSWREKKPPAPSSLDGEFGSRIPIPKNFGTGPGSPLKPLHFEYNNMIMIRGNGRNAGQQWIVDLNKDTIFYSNTVLPDTNFQVVARFTKEFRIIPK